MPKNYVSISGVVSSDELLGIHNIAYLNDLSFPIAIGYQCSHRSIDQITHNERQPPSKDLASLVKETKEFGFLPALHYYTKNNGTVVHDLYRLIEKGIEPKGTLLQFNTLPLDNDSLEEVKALGFHTIFKVAVSDKSTKQGGYAVWKGYDVEDVSSGNVIPLLEQVMSSQKLISYAMFDPSHGRNLGLDLSDNSLAIRFGKAIIEVPELDEIGLVYAGGIKPRNVQDVTSSLNHHFPGRFSIDTESGVRTHNKLDLDLVKDYLLGYAKAMKN